MKKILYLTFLCCAIPILVAQAQTYRISGKVTDAIENLPMPGVTVEVKNKVATSTDGAGRYEIAVNKGDILRFSFLGMKSKTVKIESDKNIDIVLEEDEQLLSEVVVIGYGTVKKKDLTGAVSQIKATEILSGNPTSGINQALQGRLAGVAVSQSDGAPGAGINIQIRGGNSILTSTDPLYVIDGIPFNSSSVQGSGNEKTSGMNQSINPLSSINPSDIESIDVLKDASATAIYGSRGANGVVLITTKRGKEGRDRVEFSSNFSVSAVAKKMKMISAADYARYMNEQKIYQSMFEGSDLGRLPYPGVWVEDDPKDKYYLPGPEDYASGKYPSTDWQDVIFQNAFSQEYNLSVSGGSNKGAYVFSGNILDQTGVIVNSGYTRYSFRNNINRKISDWFEIGTNMSFSHSKNKLAKTNASDNSIIRSALFYPPTREKIAPNDDQRLNWFAANPYWYVETAKDWLTVNNFFSSSYAEFTIMKDFKFRQNVGFSYYATARSMYYGRKTGEGKDPTNGFGSQNDSYSLNSTFESILTYNKVFKKIHSLNIMGATTIEQGTSGNKIMTATGFPTDITENDDMGSVVGLKVLGSNRSATGLVSFLGRTNYSLMDRYLLTASFRRDGSSVFDKRNRWSNFYSSAFAWRASEEEFIKKLNIFNNLKLRISYGETGNQGIGAYATIDKYKSANYPVSGSMASGLANDIWQGPANPNLKWETTRQFDGGIDFGFFNNRLSFTVDYYKKITSDLLQMVQIPNSTGFRNMIVNSGEVTNSGWEFSTNITAISTKDITLDFSGNISFNKNEITSLEDDQFATKLWTNADQVFLQRKGCPIGTLYGYVEDGFYDNEAEVRADPNYAGATDAVVKAMVGEIKYKNLDDDPAITAKDRQIIGDVNPDFIYGLTTNFRYKNFSASLFFQGTYGNDILNGNTFNMNMMSLNNLSQEIFDKRWTPENKVNARWPKPYGGFNRSVRISDRHVEDGSYFRLKNINLGYTFNSPVKGVESVRLSASVSNVFTITKYSWYDPDVNAFGGDASRRGVDLFSYPSSRTFSFGLQCTF